MNDKQKMEGKLEQQRKRLYGDWTPESGISKTDAFFNKLFKDIEEGTFPTKKPERKERRVYKTATIDVVVEYYSKPA